MELTNFIAENKKGYPFEAAFNNYFKKKDQC